MRHASWQCSSATGDGTHREGNDHGPCSRVVPTEGKAPESKDAEHGHALARQDRGDAVVPEQGEDGIRHQARGPQHPEHQASTWPQDVRHGCGQDERDRQHDQPADHGPRRAGPTLVGGDELVVHRTCERGGGGPSNGSTPVHVHCWRAQQRDQRQRGNAERKISESCCSLRHRLRRYFDGAGLDSAGVGNVVQTRRAVIGG